MKRLLFFLSLILLFSISTFAQRPVNKNASREAKDLLEYIHNLNGHILSGQHSYNEEPSYYYNLAKELSGNYPAIWGTDLYWYGSSNPGDRIVKEAKTKYGEGAIITLMWHVGRPMDKAPYGWKSSVQNKITDKDWEELITDGTAINNQWKSQVDTIAQTLKKLQELNIPVLWRPYHEMNGVWFWWGNKPGVNGYQKLWKMLYYRLTDTHHLNNLIWVWNANSPRDIPFDEAYAFKNYYPGNEFVDVLATDVYHYDYEQKDYNSLLQLAQGKPIALGEVGELPKANILEKQPKWSWFMVWSDWIKTANTKERIQEIYTRENTLSRETIKSRID